MVALGDLSRIPKPPKTLTLAVSGEGLSIDPLIYTVEDSELRSAIASNAPLNVAFRVQPISSGVKQLIVVVTTDSGGGQAFSLVADVRPSLNHVLGTVLQDGAIGIAVLATLVIWWQSVQRRNLAIEKRIDRAEDLAKAEPEKVKFAWDLARVKLEAYFDRNLSQVNQIFYVAVIVITVGFVFVLWGVLRLWRG
jgi:hypothetical protein